MVVEAYRTVIEALDEATLLVSGTGRLRAWNSVAAHLLGASALTDSRSLQSLVEPEKEPVGDYLRVACLSSQAHMGRLRLRTTDGIDEFNTRCSVLSPHQDDAEAVLPERAVRPDHGCEDRAVRVRPAGVAVRCSSAVTGPP